MISLPARAVIRRELLSGLRNPKPYLFLAILLLVLIFALLFLVEVEYKGRLSQSNGMPASTVRELFMLLCMGLYLSAALLVPPMAGVSICVEKQQDSYDLLRMTYIRPLSLALAKLTNVLGIYLLTVIAALPFVGIFFFLVGIDANQFTISFTLIVASAISLSAIGLLCSAWFYRTLPAIITTYIIGFLTHGGAIFAVIIWSETVGRRGWLARLIQNLEEEWISVLLPFIGIGITSDGRLGLETILYAMLYHGAIAITALFLALAILRKPTRPIKVNQERTIDDQAELKARRKRFPYYLLDPRRRRPAIPDGQNPVYAKERQTGMLSRGTFAVRILYGFTLFGFLVSLFSIGEFAYSRNPESMPLMAFYVDSIFILIVTPTLVATAMAKEWEWQNVDSLRITLLQPIEILRGKFRASVFTAALPVGGVLLGSFPLVFFGYDSPLFWSMAGHGVVGMLVCVLYTLALSFWASVTFRKSLTALMSAYAIGIILVGLAPVIAIVLGMTLQVTPRVTDQEIVVYFFLSPIYSNFLLIDETGARELPGFYGFWWFNCFAYLGISFGLLHFAKYRFTRSLQQEYV